MVNVEWILTPGIVAASTEYAEEEHDVVKGRIHRVDSGEKDKWLRFGSI